MTRPSRPTLVAAAALAALAAAPVTAQEPIDVRRPLDADAYVKVWTSGGSVRIEGRAADSLVVSGEVRRGSGRFFIGRQGEDVVKLGVEAPAGSGQAELVVRVPASATVWVRTASADIEVRGLAGSVDVHTVSGAIDVEGRLEHLYAESMGGDLRLDVTAETVRARGGAGRVAFSGAAEDLTLSTVSGGMSVDAPALRRGRFTTVGGDIRFRGGVRRAGSIEFETHDGDVELRMPPELDAEFRLSTFEGRIEAEYGGRTVEPNDAGRTRLAFETGTGESEVTARTYSGSIIVRTARDRVEAATETGRDRTER